MTTEDQARAGSPPRGLKHGEAKEFKKRLDALLKRHKVQKMQHFNKKIL